MTLRPSTATAKTPTRASVWLTGMGSSKGATTSSTTTTRARVSWNHGVRSSPVFCAPIRLAPRSCVRTDPGAAAGGPRRAG
ncbi:hypothetical protein ACFFX0_11940 [Citricoccus parietis]|uniref:Uncharacterized protein n=1 Tax=Citricoccus parietis TaxID=592307 RepID=A0ABV5FYZ1_9MICC